MSIDAFPPTGTSTDDTLDALAGLSTSANTMPFFTGLDTAALTPLTPFMRTLLDDPDLATAQATLGITGGGGGAPTDAEYIVGSANATLTQERALTTTPTVSWDLSTPGQAKAVVQNASITEAKLSLSDVTTQNVSTTAHGLVPKAPGGTTEFLRGDATWAVPPAGTSYTDEQAQDAVGAMLTPTSTVTMTYGDGGPTLQADVNDLSITEAKLTFVDVTTRDASPTAHGLLRKLSGTATEYLDGSGAWTTPTGGTNYWSRTAPATNSLATGILAFWHLEEATGNRLDSVGGNHLVPTGTTVQVTNAAGKIGNALAMNGTSGTYLSTPDSATFSAGPNMSFTLACWIYVANTGVSMGFAGKGTASGSTNFIEYLLWQHTAGWHFGVGNGSAYTAVMSTFTPVVNQWCLLIGWYDHVADMQYIQINNGTPTQVSNTAGSYDSTYPFEVGRTVGVTGQSLNGRIDAVGFWKRVLTAQERADYWNSGNGLAYPFGTLAALAPATVGDRVVLAATSTTEERLEVDGAVKLGTTAGTTDGTLRYTGTDFEGRKGGAWVSLTASTGQPLDATLTALAGLATGADQLPYATGTDTFAQTPLTAFARTLLDDTTQAAMRTTLALTPGTDVQAQDAELQAIAGLTSAADRVPYFTGSGTAALAAFTAFMRTLLDDPDQCTAQATLGVTPPFLLMGG